MSLFGDIFGTIAGIIGGNKQAKATDKAAQLSYQAAQQGIAEQARQFDVTRADYAPYQAFGRAGMEAFGDLAGLNGYDPQQLAISRLRDSPLYKSLYDSGEEAVLANASATGGLRGGNAARSLYHLGEDTLSGLIQQQLSNFSFPVGVGSGATGAVSSFGANSVAQQAALRNQGADALGQAALVKGGIAAQNWANIGSTLKNAVNNVGGFNFGSLF